MRKKMHKRLNPKNPIYDKFYVINYLELGKNWEAVKSEEEGEGGNLADLEKEEWVLQGVECCLFFYSRCKAKNSQKRELNHCT